ncbi:amidase [Rhodocaloribacter litoris]|uniref:amidase n=1 Tax=Rhodocaloribacter litoris TaxID=2558931 RepID=UPI00141FD32C|nr:amidase [Rhodocaloribacter litoris]QXD15111.1 amidase [Rhodocaloribacter litoris]
MKRRDFLQVSALGGAVALTGLPGCVPPAKDEQADAPPAVPPFELEEKTIAELQEGMTSGAYTARRLAERYLERIEAVDRGGPGVNAIIEVNPDALAIAEALDRERAEGRVRGPLHGIPVVLKDNIDTADRMHTTAGSLALAGSIPSQDAFVAQRLREAGAVILAKANLSEWANFRSTRSSSGWSGRGGQTRNPYILDRNPCGSSSGSAAAVSANLCAVAVGTETDGSVVCPSSACGVVGIKPTLGLVSRSGIIPIAHSQDTAGPMARTVTDAALLLGVLAGVDPRDPATEGSQAHPDYTRFLDPDGLRGARIGVARTFFGFHDRVDALMEEALAVMRDAGAELIDEVSLPPRREYGQAEYEVLLYEFKNDLNAYLAALPPGDGPRTLDDLIAFNEAHAEEELKYFGQEIFLAAREKGPLTDQAYLDARALCLQKTREEGIDRAFREHNLDALVAPTGGPAWPIDLINGDHFGGGSSSPAAVSGYPNVTVPAGYVFGLPVGISFFGTAYSEPTLLRLAYAFEQATRVRQAPTFLPTLPMT